VLLFVHVPRSIPVCQCSTLHLVPTLIIKCRIPTWLLGCGSSHMHTACTDYALLNCIIFVRHVDKLRQAHGTSLISKLGIWYVWDQLLLGVYVLSNVTCSIGDVRYSKTSFLYRLYTSNPLQSPMPNNPCRPWPTFTLQYSFVLFLALYF